ncbi:Cell division coordinator CpoB [Candidatus Magnetaquicoccaceae bacterium FCR-1]|uniref:Cell division coordinator CpoB n=1 Tax=Candidatus Magnetaquiglobus chichijimensis TaxID=3141448 RepID=A0ABQ0C4D5_9PROT
MRIAVTESRRALARRARLMILCGTFSLIAGCGGLGAPPEADGEPPPKPVRASDVAARLDQSEQNQRNALADLNNRLALLEKQIGQLQGSVEEVRHDGKKLNERVEQVSHAEAKAQAAASVQPPAVTEPAATQAAAPTPVVAPPSASTAAAPAPATPAAPAAPAAAPAKPAPTAPAAAPAKPPSAAATQATNSSNPKEAYEAAFQLLKEKQYDAAKTGFQNFLKNHPKDGTADNAQYWLGELHYVQRQFPEALMAFNQVLLRWPNSAKVPDSLLKIGFSFYELNDLENANTSLQRLVKDFPTSPSASLAKPRLAQIKQKLGR